VIFRVPDNFPGAGRRVYPGFLQYTGFVAMNPDRHATSHYDYFKDLIKGDDASAEAHRKFYDEYNAVLDMDADYYLETIKTVFQDYNLVHGTWDVRSPTGKIERVRPQDITTTALFTVEGELDDISGSGQTEAAHDLCTGIVRKNSTTWKPRAQATTAFSVAAAGAMSCIPGCTHSSRSTMRLWPPSLRPPRLLPTWPASRL
jgi:poly(3-hydroxybutyrate) depolymerase